MAAIVGITLAPALSAQAIYSDDDLYVTRNPLVQNPGWESVGRFITEVREPTLVTGYYHPLTMISLMLDRVVAGGTDDLGPFHRTSLALHILNTALVIGLLYLLFGQPWVAAAVGLLFGVHPMVVEQVAWVSERKTVLAAFFALVSLVLWVLHAQRTGWRLYGAALLAFALALLAKPTATPLPALMLVLDYWPHRRLNRRALIEKIPFVLVAGISGAITVFSQAHGAQPLAAGALSVSRSLLIVCYSVFFYLRRFIWPVNLIAYDPAPTPLTVSHPLVLAGVVATGILVPVLVVSRRWTRAALAGGLFTFLALLPTMGNAAFSDTLVANRYAYLSNLGFLLPVAGALSRLWGRAMQKAPAVVWQAVGMCLALAIAAAEVVGSRAYLAHWQDTEGLNRYQVAVAPTAAPLHYDLGLTLARQGRTGAAIEQYRNALRLDPRYAAAHNSMAIELAQQGRFDEAVAHFQAALRSKPDDLDVHVNLGLALTSQEKLDDAATEFRVVLRMAPRRADAHADLAVALGMQGQLGAAIEELRAAIRLKPDVADWHANMATLLNRAGRSTEAEVELDAAARLLSQATR